MQISPIKAIRKKCLDCMGNQAQEVRACPMPECSLWTFRLGINPNCGNNAQNPFLQPKNFEGRRNMEAHKLIELIKQGEKKK